MPTYHLEHPAELAGLCCARHLPAAFISLIFTQGLLRTRAALPPAARVDADAAAGDGGALIGVTIIFVPGGDGRRLRLVDRALNGGMVLKTMVLLCGLKLVATIASYSSGNAGGIFAPSLYIGAMAGGAIGMVVHRYAPFPTAEPGAYALVGMGTLFAGIIRAPMTSVFMIFEITQDYQILVPLMVANLLSFIIARRFQPEPVYHALLHQDGIHLPGPGAQQVSSAWTAIDAMMPAPALVAGSSSIASVLASPAAAAAPALLVARTGGHAGELAGVVAYTRLVRAMQEGRGDDPISSLIEGDALHAHPDHPPDVVFERVAEAGGLLPIVSREQVHHVIGVVTLDGLARFLGGRSIAADD